MRFLLVKLSIIGIFITMILWATSFCAFVQKVMLMVSLQQLLIYSIITSLVTIGISILAFKREDDDENP